jgi:hypothetical protein
LAVTPNTIAWSDFQASKRRSKGLRSLSPRRSQALPEYPISRIPNLPGGRDGRQSPIASQGVAGNGRKWQVFFGCARDCGGVRPCRVLLRDRGWPLPTFVENKGFHWVRLEHFYLLGAWISAWRAGFCGPLGRAGPDSSGQNRGLALVRRFSSDSPKRHPLSPG